MHRELGPKGSHRQKMTDAICCGAMVNFVHPLLNVMYWDVDVDGRLGTWLGRSTCN